MNPTNDFRELIEKIAPFTDKEWEKANSYFYQSIVPKNAFFSQKGRISTEVGFVISGLMRSFFMVDEKEITTFFQFPGTVAVALLSFLEQKPAIENIQALENTRMLLIKRKDLYQLYNENWKWQQVGRMLVEKYYVQMETRMIMLQSKEAKDRYNFLLSENPEILKYVPLHYVASYLGISPETLSRIRKHIGDGSSGDKKITQFY